MCEQCDAGLLPAELADELHELEGQPRPEPRLVCFYCKHEVPAKDIYSTNTGRCTDCEKVRRLTVWESCPLSCPVLDTSPSAGVRVRVVCCKDIIQSTSRHDFRQCRCGASFIDGGSAYLRMGGLGGERVDEE